MLNNTEYVQDNMGMVEPVFPTLVYWSAIGRRTEVQKEIDDLFPQLEFRYANEVDGAYTSGWGKTHQLNMPLSGDSDFFEQDLLTELPILADTLDQHINYYLAALNRKVRPYRRKSWMTALDEGDFIHEHTHGACDLTGVYYYRSIPDDGMLSFTCPVPAMAQDRLYENMSKTWDHQPGEGKLLLFPPWLAHGVRRIIRPDFVRYSVSWNIEFDWWDR